MNAVSGTRRGIKELVDGTIRLTVDLDPSCRRRFFELFPEIDMPVALAPLSPGFAADGNGAPVDSGGPGYATALPEPASEAPKKRRSLSQYAAMLCETGWFQDYLRENFHAGWEHMAPICDHPSTTAAAVLREATEVDSRAEYDSDPEAARRFHDIREAYHKWLKEAA